MHLTESRRPIWAVHARYVPFEGLQDAEQQVRWINRQADAGQRHGTRWGFVTGPGPTHVDSHPHHHGRATPRWPAHQLGEDAGHLAGRATSLTVDQENVIGPLDRRNLTGPYEGVQHLDQRNGKARCDQRETLSGPIRMEQHREEQVRARWGVPAAVKSPPPSGLVVGPQYQTVQHSEVARRYPIH